MASQCVEMMSGVVCRGIRDYTYETDLPRPQVRIGSGEVVLKVLAVGICAGDSKCFSGAAHFWSPGEYGPTYCQPPITPGHEFVGEVVSVGRVNIPYYRADHAAAAGGADHAAAARDAAATEDKFVSVGDWLTADQIVPCIH